MPSTTKYLMLSILTAILVIIAGFVPDSMAALAFVVTPNQAVPQIAQEAAGTWVPAGDLTAGRHSHTATLLSDGRVLVVGGLQERTTGSLGLDSAEIYDPISRTWSTTGSLSNGRFEHTATLLSDGTVLVAGGREGYTGSALASVEIYDPITESWSLGPALSESRRAHSATRLADGRVLVAGGRFSVTIPDVRASAEIYDPACGAWSATGSLTTPREAHSATLLPDGRVLVVNGYYTNWLASAEMYDPAVGTWSQVTDPHSCHGVAHTATLMSDGKVLVAGGACGSGTSGIVDDAELFDPATSSWTAVASLPAVREAHTATLLHDGTVLVAGGDDGAPPRYCSTLIYSPTSNVWQSTDPLATGRRNHTATPMNDGSVLAAGGWGDSTTYLASTERFWRYRVFLPLVFGHH